MFLNYPNYEEKSVMIINKIYIFEKKDVYLVELYFYILNAEKLTFSNHF